MLELNEQVVPLTVNVIHSNRVVGILPYSFVLSITVSKKFVEISLLKIAIALFCQHVFLCFVKFESDLESY